MSDYFLYSTRACSSVYSSNIEIFIRMHLSDRGDSKFGNVLGRSQPGRAESEE